MILSEFVEKYKLLGLQKAEDGTQEVAGKFGSVYEFSKDRYGAYLAQFWGRRKQKLLDAGCLLCQDGDEEGSVTFDPTIRAQVVAVRKALGIKLSRQDRPEVIEARNQRLALARNSRRKPEGQET